MKKALSFILIFSMFIGMFSASTVLKASAESDGGSIFGENIPEVTVELIPGSCATGKVETDYTLVERADSYNRYSATTRVVNATVSAVEVESSVISSSVNSVRPALKFDRNSAADQKQQKIDREIYADNGHFHDPNTFTITGAPEGYPFQLVGDGDYSGHYVSHIRVIYEKDEAGNALKDENGNYIIKELQHVSSGTPLYYNGELSTNTQGPFHYATGTRPQQFMLKNAEGNVVYAYCIDVETGAKDQKWYAIANLEDNDYYASEDAEDHIRAIVKNGYWGTASGNGSLASVKAALKAAVANGTVDKEYEVNFANRKKFTAGYVLKEGEYHYGSYVYWNVVPVDGENHVVLTDEVIDGLTEGEALDAMQMAIWSFANGAQCTLNGKDGVIVGDPYAASSQMSDSLHAKNDWAGAARTKALYEYFVGLKDSQDHTVIINDKTFAENMSLTVGKEISKGIYEAKLSFSLAAELGSLDDLTVALTYVDAYGETQTLELPLTGENAIESENGFYTVAGLELKAGEAFDFSLNIYGGQYLEQNAYILTSEGGIAASQTMVTLASGINTVNVTKSANVIFTVSEQFEYKNERLDPAQATINGYKYLDGELADGFTFVLEDDMGNIVDTATSMDGEFEFNLELDEAYTHIYHVYELNENEEGIVYDDSVFEVRIDVERAETAYIATVRLMRVSEIAFYNETEIPEETTEAPEETTEAPEETTEAPEETTEAPEETTEAPEETTEAPEETTEAPEETTEAPEVPTEPEEEITEEPTPLDPAPETTEPEEEITDPEIPLDPNPKTGDASVILVIAAVASIAFAALYIKRRQIIED